MVNICLLGEAWGQDELRARAPFVGYSGRYLTDMLVSAGIVRADCLLTNVFNLHPAGNDLDELCGPKADGIPGWPALKGSRHVRREFLPELDRLADELIEANPNIIIALGNTAMWAMLGKTGISKFRGVTDLSTHAATGFKVLPTYHPAAVIRQVELRPVTVLDLQKALRESEFPEIRRPSREIWIEPTLGDISEFIRQYINTCQCVAVDIETSGNQVTCIGFACGRERAIVIPFFDPRRKTRSYWPTDADEREAWLLVKGVLELSGREFVFQNGLYDIAFLWRSMGIRVRGAEHDTMLLHHALQPEALKGLGFLGSVYTDEGAWKQMRGTTKTIKRDE